MTARPDAARASLEERVDGFDWPSVAAGLDELGCAIAGPLLDAGECAGLVDLYDDDQRFRATIDMARYRFGEGQYRYFDRPLPGLVADLRRRAVAHPGAAERVLSTAHKAKGLEWPSVRLADDFPTLGELDAADREGVAWLTAEERDQELHLLYVAATRAMLRLEPNEAVRGCLAARAGRAA